MVHNGSISVQLSKRATSELHSVYTAHTEYNPDLRCESFDLDSLSEEMITLRKNYLEKGPGFVVVDNFWNPKYSMEQGKKWITCFITIVWRTYAANGCYWFVS